MEPKDKEILEKMVCSAIPNTRELQRIRIKHLGFNYSGEEHMRKYYSEKYASPKRIVQLPADDLKMIYELVIPLSFSNGDFFRDEGVELHFPRWNKGWSNDWGGYGAMHLTTKKNFNVLLAIFNNHTLPMKFEKACEKITDEEKQNREAVSVPHHWYVNNYDPHEEVVYHQFVVCNEKILGVPYYSVDEIKTKEEECDDRRWGFTYSREEMLKKEFDCRAFFTSSDLSDYSVVKQYISKKLKERADDIKKGFSSKGEARQLISSSVRLLKIGEPVMIYDPEWVRKS
jgi:hypothetical protein